MLSDSDEFCTVRYLLRSRLAHPRRTAKINRAYRDKRRHVRRGGLLAPDAAKRWT